MGVANHISKLINECFDAELGIEICLNICELDGHKVTRAAVEYIYKEREEAIA